MTSLYKDKIKENYANEKSDQHAFSSSQSYNFKRIVQSGFYTIQVCLASGVNILRR